MLAQALAAGHEVTRLVVVTASAPVADDFLTAKVMRPLLTRVLRESFADFAETEAVVRGSGLDWTILRPPHLTDGGTRPYRTAVDRTLRGGYRLSRADLARAMLAAAADPAAIGHAVALGQ